MSKRPGARPGNSNALKRGFYSRALKESEALDVQAALEIDGLDEEIAILRVKLRQLVQEHPDRLDLCLAAVDKIAKLVRIKYALNSGQKKSLRDAIAKVITDIAVPAGVSATKAILQ